MADAGGLVQKPEPVASSEPVLKTEDTTKPEQAQAATEETAKDAPAVCVFFYVYPATPRLENPY